MPEPLNTIYMCNSGLFAIMILVVLVHKFFFEIVNSRNSKRKLEPSILIENNLYYEQTMSEKYDFLQ